MRKVKNNLCFLFCAITIVFSSCTKPSKSLRGVWQYASFQNGNTAIPLQKSDLLVINPDHTFWYRLSEVKKYATGTWQYSNSSLILHYDSIPTKIGVDSILSQGEISEYYFNGQVIHRLGKGKGITRIFKTTFLSDSAWHFTEGNLKFEFIKFAS